MSSTLSFPSLLSRWRPGATPSGAAPEQPASLLDRLECWLWRTQQRELDLRLSGCVDIADVERVLRHVERLHPFHRYD